MTEILLNTNRNRLRATVKVEAAFRLICLQSLAKLNDSVLLTEYPKSGGTWLAEMVSDVSGKPFPQNKFPGFRSSIFHGHYIQDFKVQTVVLWRDPRDIVVSWYYHCLISTATNVSLTTKTQRDLSFNDIADVQGNLPRFIEYMFTRQSTPKFTWNQFFDNWSPYQAPVIHTSYERLSADTEGELKRIIDLLEIPPVEKIGATVSRHSFERKSGRSPGDNDSKSFLRKGIVGDWKNKFTDEAAEVLSKLTAGRLSAYDDFQNRIL